MSVLRMHLGRSIALCALPLALALAGAGGGCSVDKSGLSGSGGTQATAGNGGAGPVTGSGGTIGAGTGGSAAGAGGTGVDAAGASDGGGGTIATGAGGAGAGGNGGGAGGASGGSTGGAGGAGGAPPDNVGCADGTREAFTDTVRFPNIAGCSGGWSIAGVVTPASMSPACSRAAGNSGTNPTGLDCTIEDLCADGWHVCAGASELTQLAVTCQQAGIAAGATAAPLFFATHQRGRAPMACMLVDTMGTNNVHGCGNFALAEDPNCAPLDRQLSRNDCTAHPPWSCADPNPNVSANEGLIVVKPGAAGGGVLCCRD